MFEQMTYVAGWDLFCLCIFFRRGKDVCECLFVCGVMDVCCIRDVIWRRAITHLPIPFLCSVCFPCACLCDPSVALLFCASISYLLRLLWMISFYASSCVCVLCCIRSLPLCYHFLCCKRNIFHETNGSDEAKTCTCICICCTLT